MGLIEVKVNEHTFKIDRFLLQRLDNIKKILKRNWDCCILIDGKERSGKSTLAITCAYYLDPKFNINNLVACSEDAVKKLDILPDKSVLVIDEASLIFSSKDTMRKEQRQLIKILNVIGQKNMILIVILPSFFELNKYIAVERSRFLLHVYTDKRLNRGRYCYFSERQKRLLYDVGKKNYNSYKYPKALFVGRFDEFNPLGEEYQKTKKETLMRALHEETKKEERIGERAKRWIEERDKLIQYMIKKGFPQQEIGEIIGKTQQNIAIISRKKS